MRRAFTTAKPPRVYVPAAPSWDPRALLHPAPPAVSDADMARLQDLSRLRLPTAGGAASPYERARRDVAAVLSAVGGLAGTNPRGGGGGDSAAPPSPLAAHLAALTEAELEAAAEARWARLRRDEVTEGGDAGALVAHAAEREGVMFVAPRFVGGGGGGEEEEEVEEGASS